MDSRTDKVVASGILLVVVTAAAFWLSPYWAMAGFGLAAKAGDSYLLEEYVDFPELRENVKDQISSGLMQEMQSEETGGFEKLGMAFGMMMVDQLVDQVLTPKGLATLIQKGMQDTGSATPSRVALTAKLMSSGDITWVSSSLVYFGGDGPDEPRFVFRRSLLSWTLIGIEMPEDTFAQT